MKPASYILSGRRLQWTAWAIALVLHAVPLFLLRGQQAQGPAAAPVMVMSLLPPAPAAEPAPAPPVALPPPPPAAAPPEPARRAAPAPQALLASTAAPAADAPAPMLTAAPEPAAEAQSAPAPASAVTAAAQTPSRAPAAPVQRPAIYQAPHLDNPKAEYPRMSARAGESGRVVIEAFVTAEGRPQSVKVHASSGYPRLDMAAVDAVRRWRFEPAREGDTAVASLTRIPIDFTLE